MNEQNKNQDGEITVKVNPKNIFQIWLAFQGGKCGCVLVLLIALALFMGWWYTQSLQKFTVNPLQNSSTTRSR